MKTSPLLCRLCRRPSCRERWLLWLLKLPCRALCRLVTLVRLLRGLPSYITTCVWLVRGLFLGLRLGVGACTIIGKFPGPWSGLGYPELPSTYSTGRGAGSIEVMRVTEWREVVVGRMMTCEVRLECDTDSRRRTYIRGGSSGSSSLETRVEAVSWRCLAVSGGSKRVVEWLRGRSTNL